MKHENIYIVSAGRADRRLHTLEYFPMATLFVPESQARNYADRYPKTNIVTHNCERLAATRQAVLDRVGKKKMLMLDDDLIIHKRIDQTKYRKAEEKDIHELIDTLSNYLDEYAHAGIADTYMLQNQPRDYKVGGKYAQLLAYNLALWPDPPPRYGRVETHDDPEFNLQLATQGYYPLILTEWLKSSKPNAPGGCSVWRDAEEDLKGLKRMAELFPGIVSIIPATNTPSGYKPRIRWPKPEDSKGKLF